MKRKILASILALSMIFSMVPTAAFADGETGSDSTTQIVETKKDETVDEQKSDEQKSDEQKSDEQKSDEQKSDEQKSDEQKSDEQKSDEQKSDEQKSDEQKSNEQKTNESRSQSDENGEGRMMMRRPRKAPTEPTVAKIGNTEYKSLNEAIGNAQNKDTIVLEANVTEDVVIPQGKEVTIDLNGKTVTNKSEHTIYNNGTLTIVGSGVVNNVTHAKAAIYNNVGATATLNGGTYDRTSENGKDDVTSGGNSYYTIKNFGTMTVNKDVTVQTAGGNKDLGRFSSLFANGWYSYSDALAGKGEPNPNGGVATLTINGGTFNGGLNTIKNDDMGKILITGGTFTNYVQAALQNHNEAEITGGKFIAQSKYSVYNCGCRSNYDTGKLTIKDGEFTGMLASVGKFDDITISGGTFHDGIGFGADSSKNVKITGDAFADKVVAQVGDVKYVSIEAAINNAKSGETVKLVNDITEVSRFDVSADKNIVLDLNGHKLKLSNKTPGASDPLYGKCVLYSTVYGTLTLKDSTDTNKDGTGSGKIYTSDLYNRHDTGCILVRDGGTFVMESGFIDTASEIDDNKNKGQFGIGFEANNKVTNIVINGGHIKAGWYAVSGNGGFKTVDQNITVNGGILESTADYAIYHPQKGTTTINGGVVYGYAGGIAIKRGNLVINSGTVTSKGVGDTGTWGDGTGNLSNAAINISAEYDDVDVKIEGGNIYAEGNAVSVIKNADHNSTLTVTGGTFSDKSIESFIPSGGNYEIAEIESDKYKVGEHKVEKVADKVDPTCTETGKMEYYKCNTCGKFYVLENGAYKEVTEAGLVINALGHKTKFVAEVAAGCEKEGVKAHYECERCGKLFTDAEGKNEVKAADLVIGATGHHWGEWKVVKAATAREAGIEQAICDYCGGPWQKEIPVRATASTGTATRPSNSGSTATKDNSSSSTSSTKENANPTKADTSVADVKRSDEVVSAVKENVKVADKKATVDKDLINKVKGEKGAAVVLPIASATGESVTSTEIAKDAVKAVMDNGSDLIVELTDATVKLDNETLKTVYAQAEGDSIEIRAVKTEVASLTEAQKKALDNYDTAVVVELQIYSNGKYIANFNGGIATVKIPFTPAEGVSADEYTVYYVGGDGKLTAVASEYVDGYMIISTGHFSSYAIVRTAEKVADSSSASSQPREQTGSSFPVVPVVIAVVALICLFVLLRKKNKED